ncbi:MAG: carbamoyltransferase C-terminal domain-containing protein [Deltaproteobacteria bacterium]|nr:carbamoyltransferase C-terminal domain-containing protein [Deltaproteobacteria bacterium]
MTAILGINAYHGDSSACLVIDGRLVCAIEEERIRRVKHWAGLPVESIRWCLSYGGIELRDIDYIAIGRDPFAHLFEKLCRIIKRRLSPSFLQSRARNAMKVRRLKPAIAEALGVDPGRVKAKLVNVEHHKAHIGSSFLVSPYEEALCVTVDGFGDFVSSMRAIGRGNSVEVRDWVSFPHSLGIFYTAFTQFLGFPKYGDEYKVMGLSALGEPVHMDKMREIVKTRRDGLFELDTSYFVHEREGVHMTWEEGEPFIEPLYSEKLIRAFGKPRDAEEEISEYHRNIAASMQKRYEEAFFHLLNGSYELFRCDKLCLSGGCIQNSLANGKIFEYTPYKEIYIPPAAHDAGIAIGAAFWVWNVVLRKPREFVMDSPYWGPSFKNEEIEKVLLAKGIKYEKMEDEQLLPRVAADIASGKIVGFFQGRTEWGPRALGNRSILVDPRKKEMKDILNERIKRRETFRPFAPSVLEEFVSEWFEHSNPVPFMEKVYLIKKEKRALVPAVVHFDGTGRLQTVSKTLNPRYHRLIDEFYKLTGVPMLLNTSFNENEPIVNTPEDALNCFLRTKMDVLVMEQIYVSNER